jgi:hypothetical protein
MHRWSTSTYTCMCSVKNETELAQVGIPQLALKSPYLLDAILSIAALDLAKTSSQPDSHKYFVVGLEYYDRCLNAYNAELLNTPLSEANAMPMFLCSLCVALVMIVIPEVAPENDPWKRTALDSVITIFDLMQGNLFISTTTYKWLLQDKSMRVDLWDALPPVHLLDENHKEAMERLKRLNQAAYGANGAEDDKESVFNRYKLAIDELEGVFAREATGKLQDVAIAWLLLCGPQFSSALRALEPMAMLVLMTWGVLLHRLGSSYWWADGPGTRLVNELSERVFRAQLAPSPELRDAIMWARRQAGLPDLV